MIRKINAHEIIRSLTGSNNWSLPAARFTFMSRSGSWSRSRFWPWIGFWTVSLVWSKNESLSESWFLS